MGKLPIEVQVVIVKMISALVDGPLVNCVPWSILAAAASSVGIPCSFFPKKAIQSGEVIDKVAVLRVDVRLR